MNVLRYFSYHIPGFNEKPQNLNILSCLCDHLDITMIRLRLNFLHGCALYESGHPYLFINQDLSESEQIVAGYHEFAHLLFHPLDTCEFLSNSRFWNLSKAERQAQTVGVLALIPASMVIGLSVEDIMREFDVSRATAEFRLSI